MAIEIVPDSHRVRSMAMNFLRPRWGGSYELMDRWASLAMTRAKRVPRLGFEVVPPSIEPMWRRASGISKGLQRGSGTPWRKIPPIRRQTTRMLRSCDGKGS